MTFFIVGMGIGLFIFLYGLISLFRLGYITIFSKLARRREKADLAFSIAYYITQIVFGIMWMGFVAEGFLKTGIKI